MTLVYVSCAESGELFVYRLDAATGTLHQQQVLVPGGKLMPMAFSPDRRRLFVARRSDPLQALAFSVDGATGALAPTSAGPLPHSMANIATDASGRFLFSASYGGNLIAVSPIDAGGVVGEALQQLPTGPHAHCIAADPSGRFVLATSLGGGVVMQFVFDAETGRLRPNAVPEMSPHAGASPRHFVFSADARLVYLLNELDGAVDVLAFDGDAGTLRTLQTISAVPTGLAEAPWASDLHLTPDGRFLYASERRSHTLARFAVDASSGRLRLLGHTPTETQPRGFAITPDGGFLIAAGETSHHLSVYRIDAASGDLQLASRCATGQAPNWICTLDQPG
jgi:6-phosphogluconolactonase